MPTYQYLCSDCGNDLEAVQKFTDNALTECPSCGGALRKKFSAVGIVFKGSGFYATDNRTKGARTAAGSNGDSSHPSKATESTPATPPKSTSGKSESAKSAAPRSETKSSKSATAA